MSGQILRALLVALIALSMGSLGCAFGELRPDDPLDRELTLEEFQIDYSNQVRWSKFEEASNYMKDEHRRAFVAQMPDFDEVRFIDWEAQPWSIDEEKRNATIQVTYTAYALSMPYEVEVQETQEWTREGKGNNWTVVSTWRNLGKLLPRK